MTEPNDYECRLLAELLPACLSVADYFASSNDAAATEARTGADGFTFHQNLYYEFCRLHAGQIVADDGLLTMPSVEVTPVLEMLESRVPRVSIFLFRKQLSTTLDSQAIKRQLLRD